MAPITMHRNDWVAIVLILGATICSIAMIVFGANGCASPQVTKVQTQYTVTEGAHAAEISKCLADAKQDGGFDYFCSCWTLTNAKYGVDAGVECKR